LPLDHHSEAVTHFEERLDDFKTDFFAFDDKSLATCNASEPTANGFVSKIFLRELPAALPFADLTYKYEMLLVAYDGVLQSEQVAKKECGTVSVMGVAGRFARAVRRGLKMVGLQEV
jgi:hypothetical protein